jgi:hypothetical protein
MALSLQILASDAACERHEFPLGRFEVFKLADQMVGRAVYRPGWRWSEHVGATDGANWCPVEHIGFVVAGHLAVRLMDGTETELTPGNWFSVPAGHDSWVVGDQDYVSLHILGAHTDASSAAGISGDSQRAQHVTSSGGTITPG